MIIGNTQDNNIALSIKTLSTSVKIQANLNTLTAGYAKSSLFPIGTTPR